MTMRHGRLAEVLRAHGWTQHALAVYLGVRDMTVSDWMRFQGRAPTNPDVLRKLMELTGWSDEELFPAAIYGRPHKERPVTRQTVIREVAPEYLLPRPRPQLPQGRSAEALYAHQEAQARFREILADLPPRHQRVLRQRFGLDGTPPATYDEIGMAWGLSRERIRQIESVALRMLRHPRTRHLLQGLLPSLLSEE